MKLLMIYTEHFAYRTADKSLEAAPEIEDEGRVEHALTGLIHAEAADEDEASRVETKLVKNLKWAARKNDTQRIILHSFSHLAETKASAAFTKAMLDRAEERLKGAGYEVSQTPFGYFLDLDLRAPGKSTARIFVSF